MPGALLGNRMLPAGANYGMHTLRALENFPCLLIHEINLGATAIGTGINAPRSGEEAPYPKRDGGDSEARRADATPPPAARPG